MTAPKDAPPPLPTLTRHQTPVGVRLLLTAPDWIPQVAQDRIAATVATWWGDETAPPLLILDGGRQLHLVGPGGGPSLAWLAERNQTLADAVREAGDKFREYEALHDAKGTVDGAAKAQANRNMAARMDAALESYWTQEEPAPAPLPPSPLTQAHAVAESAPELVDDFLKSKGLDGEVSGPAGRKVLADFVDFAVVAMRERMTGCAMDVVADGQTPELRLVTPHGI